VIASTCLVLLPGIAGAQRAAAGAPTVTIPFANAADPSDVSGQEINPAALGFLQRWALGYYGAYETADSVANTGNSLFLGFGSDAGIAAGFGLLLGNGGAQNFFDPASAPDPFTKVSYSLSLRAGQSFAFGASVSRFLSDGDAGLDGRNTWDVGAIYRPSRYVSFGIAGYDLNTPAFSDINGTRKVIPASGDAGVALRPLGNDRLTLRADLSFAAPSALQPDTFRPRVTAALQPIKGIVLNGGVELSEALEPEIFQVGLTFNREFVGASAAIDNQGVLFASARAGGERYTTFPSQSKEENIVELRLSGSLDERPDAESTLLEKGLGESARGRSLYGLLKALNAAAEDQNTKAVVFRIAGFSPNAAQTEEVLTAIYALRAAGKACYVYMDTATGREYQIASACDQVVMSPGGSLMLAGITSQIPFYRGAFDLAGVEPQFIRIGEYKSAPESYTENQPTSQNVEVREQLLDDLFAGLIEQIATGRKLSPEKVKELIDAGPYTASEAKKVGLLDATEYFDEFKKRIEKTVDGDWEQPSAEAPTVLAWGEAKRPEVSVIVIAGTITKGKSGAGLSGSTVGDVTIAKALSEARESSNVKAVVLRVDSPGGDALASDLIWHEVERLKAEGKPVIVSMGGVAASGGYYVSAGADEIFADEATITGSIGIFGGKFVLSGLYDKVGVKYFTAKRGAHADWNSNLRPWSDEEKTAYLAKLNEFYTQFITKVSTGRGLSVEQVDALGRGHVYSGRRALENKLVSKTGGLLDAIEAAKERAKLSGDVKVEFYPESEGNGLLSLVGGLVKSKVKAEVEKEIAELPPIVTEALRAQFPGYLYLDPNLPWMLMPESIEVK
jgi:protease-4